MPATIPASPICSINTGDPMPAVQLKFIMAKAWAQQEISSAEQLACYVFDLLQGGLHSQLVIDLLVKVWTIEDGSEQHWTFVYSEPADLTVPFRIYPTAANDDIDALCGAIWESVHRQPLASRLVLIPDPPPVPF